MPEAQLVYVRSAVVTPSAVYAREQSQHKFFPDYDGDLPICSLDRITDWPIEMVDGTAARQAYARGTDRELVEQAICARIREIREAPPSEVYYLPPKSGGSYMYVRPFEPADALEVDWLS